MVQSWINYQESKYKPYSCGEDLILDAQNKAVNSNLYGTLHMFCTKGTEHAKGKDWDCKTVTQSGGEAWQDWNDLCLQRPVLSDNMLQHPVPAWTYRN